MNWLRPGFFETTLADYDEAALAARQAAALGAVGLT